MDTALSACFGLDCPNGPIGATVAQPCTYTPQSSACQHGTHVAGIAAGANGVDNGVTFSGVAPGATIVPIKVASPMLDGSCAPDVICPGIFVSDAIAGLQFAHALGNVDVVNMSFGGTTYSSPCGANEFGYLVAAILLVADGTAVVAASGNGGNKSQISRPACVQGVISVGNTTNGDAVNGSSNSASFLSMLAPGTLVQSSMNGTFDDMSGTSMAAPHVAGGVAVLMQHDPFATPQEILTAMQQTGKPITDVNGVTTPRLRLLAAAAALGDTGLEFSYDTLLKGGKLFSEGTSARNMPASSKTITISGIQSGDAVQEARLYFMTAGAPDQDGAIQFQNLQVGGKLVGASRAPCTVADGGATRVYKADVTKYVSGNGTYTINGIAPAGVGASLVVVTSNTSSPHTKHVQIRHGAMTAQAGESMTHAFPGFPPVTDIDFHVGVGDGDATTEDPMKLGPFSLFGINAFSGSDGGDWDDRSWASSHGSALSVVSAVNLVQNWIKTGTDCLAWAYAGLTYRFN